MLQESKQPIRRGAVLFFLLIAVLSGCSAPLEAQTTGDEPEVRPDPPADETGVTLYFPDSQAQHTVPEMRQAERVGHESIAAVVVRELIAGPKDPHLNRALPADTRILSVQEEGNVVYVNLSREIRSVYGSAGETMAVRSLVYSLTDLPGTDRVQILIEGEQAESLSGHMALDEPHERGDVLMFPVFIDEERASWLQARADEGEEEFRTDPLQAARFDGQMLGLRPDDEFTLQEEDLSEGRAVVRVKRGDDIYVLKMVQPATAGEHGIWMIESIEEE